MVMMETLSCSFCRHIFSADLRQQILRVEDTIPKLTWVWQGDRWASQHLGQGNLTYNLTHLVWLTSLFMVTIPATLVWLSAYIFPPIGGLHWNSFSMVWGDVTWGLHGLIAVWLLVEHYQLPSYIAAKITIQRALERFRNQFSEQ